EDLSSRDEMSSLTDTMNTLKALQSDHNCSFSRALLGDGGAPKPPPPFSERQARPIRRLNRTSHLAYPIGPSVPQVWLNSPSSIPLQCLKTYAIFVQTARPDSVGVSHNRMAWCANVVKTHHERQAALDEA